MNLKRLFRGPFLWIIIIAIVVIAVFYTGSLAWGWLASALVGLAVTGAGRRAKYVWLELGELLALDGIRG